MSSYSPNPPSSSAKISFGFKKTALLPRTTAAPLLSSTPLPAAFGALTEDDHDRQVGSSASASNTAFSSKATSSKRTTPTTPVAPTGLAHSAPASKASRQKAAEAVEQDSTIYDYDGVFDSLKSVQRSQAQKRQEEKAKREPKYIEGMLDSVKERNKLLLRAQAKKIEREREAEGDEYQEGEQFVTDAYREQQEELRKVEEAEREEEGKQAKNKQGLSSFYKDMMASREAEHEAAVAAAAAVAAQPNRSTTTESTEAVAHRSGEAEKGILSHQDRQAELAKEAKEKGLNAQLNEEGELVDQRSVLSAGLNVLGRGKLGKIRSEDDPIFNSSQALSSSSAVRQDGAAEARRLREEARERASRQVEDQILAVEQQREEQRTKEEENTKRRLVGEKRNDESRIAEAKRRLEERKRKKRKVEEVEADAKQA